jgi:putative ABC transport system permease protein
MWWLFSRLIRRPLRRVLLGAAGVAFPVAMLGSMLVFVDTAVQSMTRVALAPVQVEMRALASSLNVDMAAVDAQILTVPGVERVDRFASADVVVSADGAAPTPARLFAVDPSYFADHPEVKVSAGALEAGSLLAQPLRDVPGFATAATINITLPAAALPPPPPPSAAPSPDEEGPPEEPPPPPPWSMSMPVGGTADLREASTWYAVPSGDAQGDVALVPKALVIDYGTFERAVLPELRIAAGGDASWAFNPGATDLPQASVESHITIDHAAYPVDPGQAIVWSNMTRRVIERQAVGGVVVTDNAAEALTMAKEDATNAKILFLLLGIPGVLVGAGLGVAAAGALAESQRREQALLQLRGATSGQLVALTSAEAAVTAVIGSALGLAAAAAAVGAVTGQPVWAQVPVERLQVSAAIAAAAGLLTTGIRLIPVVLDGRRTEADTERRTVESGWNPAWRRARLDLVALGVGVLILAVNVLAGGLKQTPIEGQTLALAFYVLLAPIALWLGVTLLVVRGLLALLALLARQTRPGRPSGLRSWPGTAVRWLGRRPARTAAALILSALAVAFGTTVTAFTDTYQAARTNDQAAALGSDLRLTPPVDAQGPPPPITGVAATSPVWEIPARVGTDRKIISALDAASYQQTVATPAQMLSGQDVTALAADPAGVLINKELEVDFSVGPGDFLPVTVFPDDPTRTLILNLRVVGVFRSVPPMEPPAELFITSFPAPLPPPDFYLARVSPGSSPSAVAEEVRSQLPTWTATTVRTLVVPEQRALTALNVSKLGQLQAVAAGLVAAVGVAILGAFLVLERRRESVILRIVGASTGQVVTTPLVEGAIAVLGGLAIGIPVGLGLAVLNIHILALFFTLPPPLLVVSDRALGALAAVVVLTSAVALAIVLHRVARQPAATVLREV